MWFVVAFEEGNVAGRVASFTEDIDPRGEQTSQAYPI